MSYLPIYALVFSVAGIIVTLLFIGLIRSLIDASRPDPVPAVPGAPAPAPKRANDPKKWIIVSVLAVVTFCICFGLYGALQNFIDPLGGGGPVVSVERVTMSEYNQLTTGMSYQQAVKIIGFEGTEISRSEYMNIVTVMYSWSNRDGSNMNAIFQYNQLTSKAQFMLP